MPFVRSYRPIIAAMIMSLVLSVTIIVSTVDDGARWARLHHELETWADNVVRP